MSTPYRDASWCAVPGPPPDTSDTSAFNAAEVICIFCEQTDMHAIAEFALNTVYEARRWAAKRAERALKIVLDAAPGSE